MCLRYQSLIWKVEVKAHPGSISQKVLLLTRHVREDKLVGLLFGVISKCLTAEAPSPFSWYNPSYPGGCLACAAVSPTPKLVQPTLPIKCLCPQGGG